MPDPRDYRVYQHVAEQAAREAGRILLDAFGRVEAREKGPFDLLTDADLASQRAIVDRLLSEFPDHTVLGEEEGVVLDESNPWRWIVDPLDGTINFAHGLPLWCISIGLEHAGELVVGVVYQPVLDVMYSARLGGGALRDGVPIRVSSTPRLAGSLIAAAMPTNLGGEPDRNMAYMRAFSQGTHSIRRTGCSSWNLSLVAAGSFEVCYATHMHPWDAAAGVVLVREAGGRVTGIHGEAYDLYRPGILATNGLVHEEAVATLSAAWPAGPRGDGGPMAS